MHSCARRNKYAQNPHITLILKLLRCFNSHIVWFVKDIKLLLIFFAFHSASCCNLMVFHSFNCKYYDNIKIILRYIWSMPIFSCNDNISSNINSHFFDIDPNMNMPNVFRLQSLYICIRDSLYKRTNHCHHLNKVKKSASSFPLKMLSCARKQFCCSKSINLRGG